MKKCTIANTLAFFLIVTLFSCTEIRTAKHEKLSVRPLKDTIGFARYPWQMDSLMARIQRTGWKKNEGNPWKLVVCPHDDYTYVGKLYPELLQNVKAANLILIGVAHKAAQLGIEDSLVFDSYSEWKGPWSNITVSPVREEIYHLLEGKFAIINDSLQKVEHSVEAMIPYLQYFNRKINIVPILVPAMNPDRMEACGKALAEAIRAVATSHKWEWGKDYAIVVTTDAVHYGNEDWGGTNRAYFGCDERGNMKARNHEAGIIDSCFKGILTPEKIRLFNSNTLNAENFRDYKWTWCGRYSVPVALYTSYYLNDSITLKGIPVGYSTSITSAHISVDDLRMGRTAIATSCHWVGYASIGYVATKEHEMGIVTISVTNIRKEPDHASEMVSQAIMGTPVSVLKSEGSWSKIQTPDKYTGWVESSSVQTRSAEELERWKLASKILYLDNTGWIRDNASENSGVISDIVGGSILEKTGEAHGFAGVVLPDGRKGYIESKRIIDFSSWEKHVICNEENICRTALSYLGMPYLWGGSSTKGADCSGFVQSVFFRNGIILPRDAHLQADHGLPVDISDDYSRLRKGDLLFFGSKNNGINHVTHVAIYLGNNQYINASGRVMINSLDPKEKSFNSHRLNSFLEAKRIIGVKDDQGIVAISKHEWYQK